MLLENIDSVAALGNLIFSYRFAKECFISRKEEILWRVLRVELRPLTPLTRREQRMICPADRMALLSFISSSYQSPP